MLNEILMPRLDSLSKYCPLQILFGAVKAVKVKAVLITKRAEFGKLYLLSLSNAVETPHLSKRGGSCELRLRNKGRKKMSREA